MHDNDHYDPETANNQFYIDGNGDVQPFCKERVCSSSETTVKR